MKEKACARCLHTAIDCKCVDGPADAIDESPVRPFSQQSDLEKALRAHRYHPAEFLKTADDEIKKAARRKNCGVAAALVTQRIKARGELEQWDYLLELYEREFQGERSELARVQKARKQDQNFFQGALQLLKEHGIKGGSKDILAAAERAK